MQKLQPEYSQANEKKAGLPHNLIVEDCARLTASGVEKVISCDENSAMMETSQGILTVGGKDLQVSEISMETGELKIFGKIDYVQYSHPAEKTAAGFLRKLMR